MRLVRMTKKAVLDVPLLPGLGLKVSDISRDLG